MMKNGASESMLITPTSPPTREILTVSGSAPAGITNRSQNGKE